MSRDPAAAAVKYAADGYRVFPVKPGSNAPPLVKAFQRAATKDPARVAELWREFPNANPGVATGQGLVVVDCDSKRAIAQARELGMPEETPTVKTPRGGLHFYLAGRAPNRAGFQPGLDLRGTGGYAVGAGARRVDGAYEWLIPPWEPDEARIPLELEGLFRETQKKDKRSATEIVLESGRNNHLTRVGGAMQRTGMSAEAIGAGLHCENAAKCQPPLAEREVDRIVKSCTSMSGAAAWVLDPWSVTRDEELSPRAQLVLLALCRVAKDDGMARGGEWLATWTGLPRQRITEAVRELEQKSLIETRRQRREANLYKLISASSATSSGRQGRRGVVGRDRIAVIKDGSAGRAA